MDLSRSYSIEVLVSERLSSSGCYAHVVQPRDLFMSRSVASLPQVINYSVDTKVESTSIRLANFDSLSTIVLEEVGIAEDAVGILHPQMLDGAGNANRSVHALLTSNRKHEADKHKIRLSVAQVGKAKVRDHVVKLTK